VLLEALGDTIGSAILTRYSVGRFFVHGVFTIINYGYWLFGAQFPHSYSTSSPSPFTLSILFSIYQLGGYNYANE
jgi:hypothetical protein